MSAKAHWETVYETRAANTVSWFQPHAETSLALIRVARPDPASAIIDVGGGASTLVDDLLATGYQRPAVLDLSAAALATSRARLGAAANAVEWIVGDITEVALPPQAYDLWHDRAVFHFLTEYAQREAYRAALQRALRPGGDLVIATFADDGPLRCSGLPVQRYEAATLAAEFAAAFQLLESRRESHRTPAGGTQSFLYCHLQLRVH